MKHQVFFAGGYKASSSYGRLALLQKEAHNMTQNFFIIFIQLQVGRLMEVFSYFVITKNDFKI